MKANQCYDQTALSLGTYAHHVTQDLQSGSGGFSDCPRKDCPFTWDLRAFQPQLFLLDTFSSKTALSLGTYALSGKWTPSSTINTPSARECVTRKKTSSRALEALAFARRRTALSPGTYAPSISKLRPQTKHHKNQNPKPQTLNLDTKTHATCRHSATNCPIHALRDRRKYAGIYTPACFAKTGVFC